MKYSEPIVTDRSAEDIANRTAKVFFNVADWQRIYNNSQVTNTLAQFLMSANITFHEIAAPTITTIPTAAQLNTLLSNINNIVVNSGLPSIQGIVELKDDWQEGGTVDSPDYLDANEWEQVLDLIFKAISNSAEYFIYSGVSNTGQPRFYQHRFRQYPWIANSTLPVRRARVGVAGCGTGLIRNNSYRRYD